MTKDVARRIKLDKNLAEVNSLSKIYRATDERREKKKMLKQLKHV